MLVDTGEKIFRLSLDTGKQSGTFRPQSVQSPLSSLQQYLQPTSNKITIRTIKLGRCVWLGYFEANYFQIDCLDFFLINTITLNKVACSVTNIRHLKIPGWDELGQLPEVNSLNQACARELSTHLSAVLISSRTHFARPAVVSKTWVFCSCFASITVPIDFIFSYIDRNVYKVHSFHDCSVEHYAEIRKCE